MSKGNREISYHSWDVANRTLAFVRGRMVLPKVMSREAIGIIKKLDIIISQLIELSDTDNVAGIPAVVNNAAEIIREVHNWVNGLIMIDSAEVVDLLDGRLVKSLSQRDRARLLKEFVGKIRDIPDTAIAEHQGSKIGRATPTFNLAIAHQLCYHYADSTADFVSINSSRKNKISLANGLSLVDIANIHGRKIGRDPALFTSDQKKAARKMHTAKNMIWFCKLWNNGVLVNIKPNLINHVADAFMQMLAHHFSQ